MALDTDATAEPRLSPQEEFIEGVIRPVGVSDLILDAFRQVDRAAFAPEDQKDAAYSNAILVLKDGSTISQPSLVALMMDVMNLDGKGKVLEIGTASGYGAALLSYCANEVHTVEYDPELADQAARTLAKEGFGAVKVHHGDGALGVPEEAPFKAILLTAGVPILPPALTAQLEPDGVIVAPVGKDPYSLRLTVAVKQSSGQIDVMESPIPVSFVPLVSSQPGGFPADISERVFKTRLQIMDDTARAHGLTPIEFLGQTSQAVAESLGIPYQNQSLKGLINLVVELPEDVQDSLLNG